ncbi:MAG: hypothetical protein AB1659_13335, partial [Thermodesulfobacteriota bacterium]
MIGPNPFIGRFLVWSFLNILLLILFPAISREDSAQITGHLIFAEDTTQKTTLEDSKKEAR